MLNFVIRRFASSVAVLLVATFLIYVLADFAMDPLQDLRVSTAPNKAALIAQRIADLQLDVPSPLRYLDWLQGVGGCLVGQCDLGEAWRTNQAVSAVLASALIVTLKLVTVAVITAMALGVAVGVVSALRQYSGFDYGIIFLSFLLYSLPTFWVAVLLKQWVAIGFNDFLADPSLSPWVILAIGAVIGAVFAAAIGGDLRRRLTTFGIAAGASGAVVLYISATQWLNDPGFGPVVIAVTGVGIAYAVTLVSTGLRNKRALYSAITTALVGAVLWFPLQFLFRSASSPMMVGLMVLTVGIGIGIGLAFGGPDRGQSARTAGIVAVLVGLLIFADRILQAWRPYAESSVINGRPVPTIGSQTPGLAGSYWSVQLDSLTHLMLPTMALILISFASYTRYSRASMLEVMNQDYVRTARAKGLTERTVIMRHAFRNSLIPLATIIPLDLAALLGGAIITERIFGWSGMGTLFLKSLSNSEIDPLMIYVLIIGSVTVLANFAADLLYAALDPRIRVNA
ncbi:ABC transporter permease [Cellulomonas sp. KRMCY2]|uniref:ABC transporter permease n=1 Tax=Cellulomonas sp. KRMCY2 TaxID=1304865 RepID=UPI00045EC611|nr:ABC transporter permease [Cellulomonas sp. KRMCY2]